MDAYSWWLSWTTKRPSRLSFGELTEAEQQVIDNLSTSDTLDIVVSLVSAVAPTLAAQTNEDHAAARAVGFEDAVHDMLTFVGSDWFDLIVDAVLAGKPGAGTPVEYAQAIVDAALGEGVLEVVEIEPREPVWWQDKPPRGHKYGPPALQTAAPGTCVVDAYEARIQAAQGEPELIVLELPGLTLALGIEVADSVEEPAILLELPGHGLIFGIEVSDGDALCDA
jgi:hypothetical protein